MAAPTPPLCGSVGLDFGLGNQVAAAVQGRWIPRRYKAFLCSPLGAGEARLPESGKRGTDVGGGGGGAVNREGAKIVQES